MTGSRSRVLGALLVVAAPVALVGLWACTPERSVQASASVRDSAGVRITEYEGVADVPPAWSLDPEPLFQVGWTSDGPQFQGLQTGFLTAEGGAVVAEWTGGTIYKLSASGEVVWEVGRQGQGPAEFSRLTSLVPMGADSFLVFDQGNTRVTVFDGAEYVSDQRFEGFFAWAVYDPLGRVDGTFALLPRTYIVGALTEGDRGWRDFPILTTTDFVRVDTIGHRAMWLIGEPDDMNPVRHTGLAVFTGDAIAHAQSDRPEVTWMDVHGTVTDVTRWDTALEEVTDADWAVYEANARATRNMNTDAEVFEQRMRDRHEDFGGTRPLFRIANGDTQGNVWLGVYDFGGYWATRYLVVNRTGSWVGTVDFPRPIQILDISQDVVLGVERDALDVQAVVVYEVRKPNG